MIRLFTLLVCCIWACACSVTKFLGPEDRLYTGAEVELVDTGQFVDSRSLRLNLEDLASPDPNSKLRLWAYYSFGDSVVADTIPRKGLGNFIKRKMGQPPVFYQEDETERSILRMRKHLYDLGYFNSSISSDTTMVGQKVTTNYRVKATGRHRFGEVNLPGDSSGVSVLIRNLERDNHIESGAYYALKDIVNQRQFLTEEIRNRGYFDFTENDIFFFVDTNAVKDPGAEESDIWIRTRDPGQGDGYKQYYMGYTHIYPNYNLNLGSRALENLDSFHYRDIRLYHEQQIIKARTLDESIAQRKGDLYSAERHEATNNHLLDLGIYKFVNTKYRIREENDTSFIDRYIYLTPGEVQDVSAELEASTRAGAYGMSVKGTYSHGNIFRGAERLDLSLSTGFERGGLNLISDDTIPNDVIDVTGRASLTFPRFIVPFFRINQSSAFHIPRTRVSFIANYQRRKDLFTSTSYRMIYGYDWQETQEKRHQVNLFSWDIVTISDETETFEDLLEENPRLRRSLTDMLVMGGGYTYTLTDQQLGVRTDYFFLRAQLEFAGNLLYLGSRAFSDNDTEPYKLFGREFSQFTKVDLDFRYHWLARTSSFVTRFSAGVGVPYLNSSSLPYIKQYFVGGTNSMRAFPVRGLLGSFRENTESDVAVSSFEQTGEIMMEANLEYRFDLFPQIYLKGAFFVDVGNTWLMDPQNLEEDERKVFRGDRFLSELAVGAGTGVRIDIQYLVLRLDLAIPLRKPFLDQGERWTFNNMGTHRWLWDNLTFNIALGYPF